MAVRNDTTLNSTVSWLDNAKMEENTGRQEVGIGIYHRFGGYDGIYCSLLLCV